MAYLLQQIFVPIMLVFFPKGAGPWKRASTLIPVYYMKNVFHLPFFFLMWGGWRSRHCLIILILSEGYVMTILLLPGIVDYLP